MGKPNQIFVLAATMSIRSSSSLFRYEIYRPAKNGKTDFTECSLSYAGRTNWAWL